MTDNNEKNLSEVKSVELDDLPEELSEEQLEDVKGGDLKTGTRPIIKKVVIRP